MKSTIFQASPDDRIHMIETLCVSFWGRSWQTQCAEFLGVQKSTVWRWLSGERNPAEEVILKLRRHAYDRIRDISIAVEMAQLDLDSGIVFQHFDRDTPMMAVSAARDGLAVARVSSTIVKTYSLDPDPDYPL